VLTNQTTLGGMIFGDVIASPEASQKPWFSYMGQKMSKNCISELPVRLVSVVLR
jgi:hypothetical protein